MYNSACKVAEKEGVIVMHGSRGIFHNDKHPTYRSVYKVIEDVCYIYLHRIFIKVSLSMTGKMIYTVGSSYHCKKNWMLHLRLNVALSNTRFPEI